jgi:hypothetical protein
MNYRVERDRVVYDGRTILRAYVVNVHVLGRVATFEFTWSNPDGGRWR